jgi:energy-coupling factor transporter ATP-binding protein EcfA2
MGGPGEGREGEVLVEVDGLTKRYGDELAGDDVSFSLRAGTVTGFLGPNGAGTSTTLRMMVGLTSPTAGEARILGHRFQALAALFADGTADVVVDGGGGGMGFGVELLEPGVGLAVFLTYVTVACVAAGVHLTRGDV